jgi:hypothetical protein
MANPCPPTQLEILALTPIAQKEHLSTLLVTNWFDSFIRALNSFKIMNF